MFFEKKEKNKSVNNLSKRGKRGHIADNKKWIFSPDIFIYIYIYIFQFLNQMRGLPEKCDYIFCGFWARNGEIKFSVQTKKRHL